MIKYFLQKVFLQLTVNFCFFGRPGAAAPTSITAPTNPPPFRLATPMSRKQHALTTPTL